MIKFVCPFIILYYLRPNPLALFIAISSFSFNLLRDLYGGRSRLLKQVCAMGKLRKDKNWITQEIYLELHTHNTHTHTPARMHTCTHRDIYTHRHTHTPHTCLIFVGGAEGVWISWSASHPCLQLEYDHYQWWRVATIFVGMWKSSVQLPRSAWIM